MSILKHLIPFNFVFDLFNHLPDKILEALPSSSILAIRSAQLNMKPGSKHNFLNMTFLSTDMDFVEHPLGILHFMKKYNHQTGNELSKYLELDMT